MEIKYLKELQENPTDGYWFNSPIPESEITELEVLFNNGKEFPIALRELLFLAGSYCYVLDYGVNDSQHEMQDWVREQMKEEHKEIREPFYIIDVYGGSQFLFVYLNRGDDPIVHSAEHYSEEDIWIRSLPYTLSEFIKVTIERVKQGRNPF